MTRLIDVDALLEAIERDKHAECDNPSYILQLIENAPTIQRAGWVSVPIEPTHEMITRAFHLSQKPGTLIKDMYKAMIQVAPTDKE